MAMMNTFPSQGELQRKAAQLKAEMEAKQRSSHASGRTSKGSLVTETLVPRDETGGVVLGTSRSPDGILPPAAEGTWYRVRQGDDLPRIAELFGFHDWHRVWDQPNNAQLRKERGEKPYVLFPGDCVFVPKCERKWETGETEARHTFVLRHRREILRLLLRDADNQPLARIPYTLIFFIGDQGTASADTERFVTGPVRGTTGAGGEIAHEIPHGCRSATLEYEDHLLSIHIGELDPVTCLTGIQQRLNNLGYDAGAVDGVLGPHTRRALRAFQRDNKELLEDGIPGSITRRRLDEVYQSQQTHTPDENRTSPGDPVDTPDEALE